MRITLSVLSTGHGGGSHDYVMHSAGQIELALHAPTRASGNGADRPSR